MSQALIALVRADVRGEERVYEVWSGKWEKLATTSSGEGSIWVEVPTGYSNKEIIESATLRVVRDRSYVGHFQDEAEIQKFIEFYMSGQNIEWFREDEL